MVMIKNDILGQCLPGDILLTSNPAGIGKLINFGQGLEEPEKCSQYGHIAIFAKCPGTVWKTDGMIYESVMTISKNSIDNYDGKKICIIRHSEMTEKKFYLGREEILDNIGQIYPFHRLAFHGLDMVNAWIKRCIFRRAAPLKFRYMKLMPLDWPVCSELGEQFMMGANCNSGIPKDGWRGVNPDDFDDARFDRPDIWTTILEGKYTIGG